MKNKIICAACFFTILLSFASCNKWLDLKTIGSKTTENYITDIPSAIAAYNGVQDIFQNLYANDMPTFFDVISDDAFVRPDADATDPQADDRLNFGSQSGSQFYGPCYTAIARVNTALPRVEALVVDAKDQDMKNTVLGQFHFMRAFFYFTLLKIYGQVPIVPEVTSVQAAQQPRASFNDLYAYIEKDMTEAVKLLPSSLDGTLGKEYGKPYKYSAFALMADFYLYFEKWDNVVMSTDSIINSGKFAKAPYTAIFHHEDDALGYDYSPVYNKEVLLDADFNEYKGEHFTWFYTPMGRHQFRAGYHLASAYCTENDLDPSRTEAPSGGKNGGEGLMDVIENGDLRRQSFFYTETDSTLSTYGFTGTIKYDGASFSPGNSQINYPVYRYSEILLMKAEAENELGQSADAMQIINDQIRDEAGLPPSAATSQDEVRKEIWRERRIELCFESKRFFDLNRTGRVKNLLVNEQVNINGDPISPHLITNPITGKQNMVFALPLQEINANPFIKENNPGY